MNLSWQLHEVSKKLPEKTAYIFNGQSCSYQELDASISNFAAGLQKLGIKKGDHVGLLLGNSPHFVISLYGALRLGATVIPINPIYTPDEIGYILMNGDVKVVIAVEQLLPLVEKIEGQLPSIEHFILCGTTPNFEIPSISCKDKMKTFAEILQLSSTGFVAPKLESDDTAVILFTSGTTGKPKGAMLTHQNLYRNARDTGKYLRMNEEDRIITALPMFHVFCLTVALNAPLMCGATLLIQPKFSPKEVFSLAKKYKPTIFAGVPTMYNFLLQYSDSDPKELQSLRLCISGGASMPVALLENFEKKFQVIVSEGYGLSEASPVTCFNPLDRPRKAGSIGTSIMNVKNKVVNTLGEDVPVGEVGELVVRGPNVMKGYYKMPEETKATIRNGWLYTGDLARMDEDGYFYIVDRKKDLVVVGGYNVYPREVEEVIYNHPDVVEVAVLGVPDSEFGEVVKCFVVSKNPLLTENDLLTYCQEYLAKYKIPQLIEFLSELPKNTTGKILRRTLKQNILQGK